MSKNRPADVKYGDGSIRVRQRKDGVQRYQARWHDGVQWRSNTFATQDDAEDFLRKRSRAVRSGRYVADDDVTLLHAIDEYLERAPKQRDWSSNTRASYGSVRDMVATQQIGKTRVSEITTRQCQSWIETLAKKYSAARMVVIRAVVNGALNECRRLGIIDVNPMQGVRMSSPKKRDYVIWTAAQARQALQLSKRHNLMHAYYMVALNTGMRPGELRALLWSDINLDTGSITVSATMTRTEDYSPARGTTTKGKRSRRISISADVVSALKAHALDQKKRQLQAQHWNKEGYVFDRGNGSVIPQQTVARWHTNFCKTHNLPECRLHDLRHSCVTILLEAGVDIMVISEMLGHKTVRTTQDVYAHITDLQLRNVADVMQSVLAEKDA